MNQTTQNQNTAAPIPLRWRIRNWLFRELFATEYTQLNTYRQLATNALQTANQAQAELEQLRQPRRVRFMLEAGLPEEQIVRRLAGTIETPAIQAVMALVDRKIVEMSDRATNPPSDALPPDLRTYEAGGANAIAEFKSRLQDLTALPPEEKKAS